LKPNIFFLVIDSLRSDRFFEDKSSITPNIDKLKNIGTYFSQNISSADGTLLSLNTIFSGLFPCTTGTREIKLSLDTSNYLTSLKNEGYSINSVIPNLSSFNSLKEMSEKTYSFDGGPPADTLLDGVGEKIIKILSDSMNEPWFFYMHIFDLHWPLVVPKEFDKEEFGKDKYDRILSSIDFYIGKFIDKIDLEETIIILTSDHGCPLPFDGKGVTSFEPNLDLGLKTGKKVMPKFTHKFGAKIFNKTRNLIQNQRLETANKNLSEYQKRSRLPPFIQSLFDELVKTPLLFSGYKIKSMNIQQQTRSIDIFPTLFDLLNFNHSTNVQGKSLLSLLNNKSLDESPCYMHTIPHEQLSDNDLVGVRTSKYKYFRHARDSSINVHLYDLSNDPLENQNIFNLEKITEMENILTSFSNLESNIQDKDSKEEAKIREELKKLGYL
jgi:arylsulfatase A-like enzyme